MAIISIKRDIVGGPNWVKIVTTDTLEAITTAGYLTTQEDEIEALQNGSFQWIDGDGVEISYLGGTNVFTRDAVTNAFVLMNAGGGGGSITVPTITDHIIVALDNAGTIGNILTNENKTAIFNGIIQSGLPEAGNPGFFSTYTNDGAAGGRFIFQGQPNVDGSDVRVSNRAHETDTIVYVPDSGSPESNFLISRYPGTQLIESGSLEIESGDMTVTDGSLALRVSAIGSGSLQFRHIDSGGDFFVLVQNRAMGQNSTYTIPDIGQSQGAFVVSTTPFLQKLGDAMLPGGNDEQEVIDDFCTTGCVIYGSWRTQTTATPTLQIVPQNGSFLILTEVDPGAGNFRYTICKPQSF